MPSKQASTVPFEAQEHKHPRADPQHPTVVARSRMIPWWKVVRETDRFVQQVKAALGLIWEPFVQRRYDRSRAKHLIVTPGAQTLQKKIAIYLIYQPSEILASTLETCRTLDRAGYSLLVVSNTPLVDTAMSALQAVTWRIIQRPNYGYDFGGYRDGILHLFEQGITPDWLIVMNDSIWFPLGETDTLLPRMERSGLDVTGTLVHRDFRKTWLRRRTTRVIESYFFLFGRDAIACTVFRDFWQKYRVSSNKVNAVHRGEHRLAEVMMAGGLKTDGLFGRDEFLNALADQPDSFLRKTIHYGAYSDDDLGADAALLLAQPDTETDWRQRALDHIARTSAKRNFHAAFVYASMQLLDIPFLKKAQSPFQKLSYGTLYTRMRAQYLTAVLANDLPGPRAEVIAEIKARDGIGPAAMISVQANIPTVKKESM
jgi:hypothetical protein